MHRLKNILTALLFTFLRLIHFLNIDKVRLIHNGFQSMEVGFKVFGA
jgi:hypothetical protein